MTGLKKYALTRTDTGFDHDGVFGTFMAFTTMEDDDLGNQKGKSCIPAGSYICKRTIYHKKGYETFEVTNVPGRSRILFHPANTEEDVEGCIGLGTGFGKIERVDEDTGEKRYKKSVVNSKIAFESFMESMKGIDAFLLVIREEYK